MADQAQSGTFGASDKGKGKAPDIHEDVSMGEDESDEDESNDEAEEHGEEAEEEEEDDEDNMEEIDTSNIIHTGRRTRGKVIDFAKAAEKEPPLEEDEEEDEDYNAPNDGMEH